MRDIASKTDNSGDTLSAGAFNANIGSELENIAVSADFTLDAEAGPDTNLNMLGQTVAAYANAGQQYQDSGAVNAYVLAISTNLKSVSKYYDGMKIAFKPGNTNTGASTVNVAGLGVKDITDTDGNALGAGVLVADTFVTAVYNLSSTRFELIPANLPVEIYEPAAEANGITVLEKGAIYKFDDWDGTGILTGSNAWPVPYKKSLSNVFTGFEVVGYKGNGSQGRTLAPDIGMGFHWIKNRTAAVSSVLAAILSDMLWSSDKTDAQGFSATSYSHINNEFLKIGNATSVGTLASDYISWNWSYPLAKAWHPNGETTRKVPTPWGIVDSVEANASANIAAGGIIIELYNPLTGNGCLLYVGTGVAGSPRSLDISGGIAPEFMISKVLSAVNAAFTYHSQFDGGTAPEDFYIQLESTQAEQNLDTAWNDTAPTSSLISLGSSAGVNADGLLYILYYFAPVTGLQKFGGYAGDAPNANNQATGCKDGMFFAKGRTGVASSWIALDHFRGDNAVLFWNSTSAEGAIVNVGFGAASGMEIDGSDADVNAAASDYVYGHFGEEMVIQGDFDVYPPALTSITTNNKVRITFEYKGTAALNTALKAYSTREAGLNWVLGTLVKVADLSDGWEQITTEIDISANAVGTAMRWRLVSAEGGPYTQIDISNLKITWR